MLNFLTLKPDTFGLDISDLSLKIVKLKKKGRFLGLSAFAEEKIESGLIKAGEIRDEDKVAEVIKKALKKLKNRLNTKYVVASLPEEHAFLQVIQMPKMPEEDLKSAVIYEAENYIPLPIEEVYLDSEIIKPVVDHLDHFDVLIAALPKKTVDSYLNCLKKAGLLPQIMEIESLAIARSLIKSEISPLPVLLTDLGATRTSFIIFSGYSLRWTSSIPVSSHQFTEVISKTLNVDLKKAENLKIKRGIKNKEIFEAVVPALTDLTKQVKKHLDYYQSHASHEHLPYDGKGVTKILLSGGGANLKGLTDFLSLEFKIPVELGNPWANILPSPLKEVPELSYEESLRYTTALGLALRRVND
jgi:type IV pilus assembly protein PilM